MRQGRLQDAEMELTTSIKYDSTKSKTHFALSLVYRRMKRTDEAAKQFAIYQKQKQNEENGTPDAGER